MVLWFSAFCLIYLAVSTFIKNGYRVKKGGIRGRGDAWVFWAGLFL